MQITLVQSEIEQALRTYVNNLINIKEGTQINIDLSAGRGADGFKATIDIVQLDSVIAPVGQTQKAETKSAAEEKPAKAEPKKEKKAEQTQTSSGAVAEAGSAQLVGDQQSEDEDATESEVQAEAEAQTEQAAPRKSLFGGLTKPVNE